jgi:hypothetical protein
VEATGRGYTQGGAGEYPLSEIETRSVVTFLLSHPNVYVVNSMDTRVPMHLRPPSTSASEERMYPEDLKWYEYFDELGKKLTGYERAGDVYMDYGGGRPLFGHGPDFGYWYYGSIWYGDELWNGARYKDYDGDGDIDQLDLLRWDEEENNGDGFIEWTKASHPEFGAVEIGGFHPKFFSQNPPAKHLEPWAANQAMFNLDMVKHLPELVFEDVEIKAKKKYDQDSTDYEIKVTYRNAGKLPTALKQAHLVKIVMEDQVELDFDSELLRGDAPVVSPIREKGESGRRSASFSQNSGFTEGGEKTSVSFRLRQRGNQPVEFTVRVLSTRGGVLEKKMRLE